MANFGIGLGAFMDGVTRGIGAYETVQAARDRKRVRDLAAEGTAQARAQREADIGKSIVVGSAPNADNSATVPTYQVGEQTYANETDARAAAEKQVGTFMDYYTKTVLPRYQQHWMETGQVDKAQAVDKWMQDQNVQKGVKLWANAVRSFQIGDREGFKKNLMAAYNQQGYYQDGVEAQSIEDVTNDKGQLTGYKITFKDAKGQVTEQSFDGEDVARLGLNALSPAEVLSYGVDQLKQAQAARAELAKEGRAFQRDLAKGELQHRRTLEGKGIDQQNRLEAQANASTLRRAEKAEEARSGTNVAKTTSDDDIRRQLYIQQRKEGERKRELNQLTGRNDPVFNDLPPKQQEEIIEQQLQIIKRNTTPSTAQSTQTPSRGIPVWRP